MRDHDRDSQNTRVLGGGSRSEDSGSVLANPVPNFDWVNGRTNERSK